MAEAALERSVIEIPPDFKLPSDAKFWDLEGGAVASLPDHSAFLVSRGGGKGKLIPFALAIEGGANSIPARLSRSGFEISEEEFREMVA